MRKSLGYEKIQEVRENIKIYWIKGEREKYENKKWEVVEKNDYSKLPKIEANIWIMIYNLFMNGEFRKMYDFNDYRKSNLLRVFFFLVSYYLS